MILDYKSIISLDRPKLTIFVFGIACVKKKKILNLMRKTVSILHFEFLYIWLLRDKQLGKRFRI
jgi:hypothetical protein